MGIKGVDCVSVGYKCACDIWEQLSTTGLYIRIRARGYGVIAGSFPKREYNNIDW